MTTGPDARAPRSRLGILGALVAFGSALSLPWVNERAQPARVRVEISGAKHDAAGPGAELASCRIGFAPSLAAIIVSVRARAAYGGWWLWALGSMGLLGVWGTSEPLIATGRAAGDVGNVALWGSAVWLSMVGYATVTYAGVSLLRRDRSVSAHTQSLLWLPFVLMVVHAWWLVTNQHDANNWLIRVFQEEAQTGGIQRRIREHLWLAAVSGLLSIFIGFLLGVWGYYRERVARISLYVAGIILTLPSLALFGMLMDPFSALANAFPVLRDYGVAGLGAAPAITGLTLYGLLPVIRNTYAGLRSVSAAQVDAAHGMGMSQRQMLFIVLLPRAVPVIMAGVRQTAVLLIGIATLAQLIGGGGLGYYILMGINRASIAHILLGSIPAVIVAVVVDAALDLLARACTPKGLRVSKGVSI